MPKSLIRARRLAARRRPIFRLLAFAASILGGAGLTSCGGTSDENSPLIDLSTRDLHLDAVFGGTATTARLKVKATGLRIELHGTEQAPWLGLGEQPDGLDFGAVLYDFWPTDTTLSGAHHSVELRVDVFRQIDPAFERKVGSSTLHLTYDIQNQIAYQGQLRTFHAVQAGSAPPTQAARLIGERGSWKLSPSDPWLTVSPDTGTGLADITIGIDKTQLPPTPGSYTAMLTAKGSGSREPSTLAVTLLLDSPSFSLPRQSIALTSDAGSKVEPELVPVLDTGSGGIPFSFESSETWLTVSGDNRTGGNLSIGAIAGMKAGIHRATITLRADEAHLAADSQVPAPATLNVSLYVSANPLLVSAVLQLPPTARQPIADPLRPYVYVIIDERTLEAYDIETGERIATAMFSSPLGKALISAETDQLYISEMGAGRVHALTLPGLTESNTFDVGALEPQLALTRCAGRNQLWSFTEALKVWDLETGTVVTPTDIPLLNSTGAPPAMFESATGDTLFISKVPDPDPEFDAYDVDCTSVAAEPVRVHWRAALATDFARLVERRPQIAADGRTVCFQVCVDAQTLTPLTGLPAAATDALMDRSFVQLVFGNHGGIFVGDTDGEVLRFDPSWQPAGNVQVMPSSTPGITPPQYQLLLTGDERRLVSLDDRAVLNVWNAH